MTIAELLQNGPTVSSGIFAGICLTTAPMFRSRPLILLAQIGAGIGFATHYALLGIAVASIANVLGTVQTLAALFSERSSAMNRLGYALIVIMAARLAGNHETCRIDTFGSGAPAELLVGSRRRRRRSARR